MPSLPTAFEVCDNGGRRRRRDRRVLVAATVAKERRTCWERRSGYDRRLQRYADPQDNHLSATSTVAGG